MSNSFKDHRHNGFYTFKEVFFHVFSVNMSKFIESLLIRSFTTISLVFKGSFQDFTNYLVSRDYPSV